MFSYSTDERMRLWRKEHEPKFASDLTEMRLKIDAELGRQMRELIAYAPHDHNSVLQLVNASQQEILTQELLLKETFRLKEESFQFTLLRVAAGYPVGAMDPATEVRERIKSNDSSGETYSSPLLMESLFWEGLDKVPNEQRTIIELQFPEHVDTLLDFHCVAFHADVAVFKELLDKDLRQDPARKQQLLSAHKTKMEALMKMYAKDRKNKWKKEQERRRTHSRSASAESAQSGIGGPTGIVRKQTRLVDTPVILESAAQRKSTAPLQGILKNKSVAQIEQTSTSPPYATWEPPCDDSDSESDDNRSFFRDDQLNMDSFLETGHEDLVPYHGPEIVVANPSPRIAASATLQESLSPGSFALFHPVPEDEWDPAASANDGWQTWGDVYAQGKGKERMWS